MTRALGSHSATALVVLVTAAVTAGAPAVARTVADYARNAGKVDGRDAVGARASLDKRAGRLVATTKRGFLPNGIIRKAPNAAALGGIAAERYATECGAGSVAGAFTVPAHVGPEWTEVTGFAFVRVIGGSPPGIDECRSERIRARRVSEGVYEARLGGIPLCSPGDHIRAVVTPLGASPAVVAHETTCTDDDYTALRLRTWNVDGAPVDVGTDVVTLEPVVVPLP